MVVITPEPLSVNFTPFALAKMSEAFFQASNNYTAETPIFNFYLYCASIELGLKAGILAINNSRTANDLKTEVGHDLLKAYVEFEKLYPDLNLLDSFDQTALGLINDHFKSKGLEYITLPVIVELVKGLSSFPKLADIQLISSKVYNYLGSKKYFISLR